MTVVAYHAPTLHTVYAQRTIYEGFRYAFGALGCGFETFTAGMRLGEFLDAHAPDVFVTSSHFFSRRQLDLPALQAFRRGGGRVVCKVDFWNPLPQRTRKSDSVSLRDDRQFRQLLADDAYADEWFHVVEQDDGRMAGFTEALGKPWHTVPLAADERLLETTPDAALAHPVVFLGTWLPAKKEVFAERLFPLRRDGLELVGQDWTRRRRLLGLAQRAGQLLNVPGLRAIQRPTMGLADEGVLYASATVSVNLHEWHQVQFGGDCNERTFKVPAAGGFEVVDDVACIHRYFAPDELVVARDTADWFEKIRHYLRHPEERAPIVERGRERVRRDHTYRQRALRLLEIAGVTPGG